MNQIFQFKRFIKLVQYRIIINQKVWLAQVGAFTGVAFIVSGILFSFPDLNSDLQGFDAIYQLLYMFLLIATGAYLTSRSFVEYKGTSTGFTYMMLPASTFEKFVIPAFFGGIAYFIFYTIVFVLLAWCTNWFWSLIYDYQYFAFNPFSEHNFYITTLFFIIYMIIQPLFLIGSITLRKNHFIISGIWIFVGVLFFLFYSLILNRLMTGEFGEFGFEINPGMMLGWKPYLVAFAIHCVLQIPVYFKLKEKEV